MADTKWVDEAIEAASKEPSNTSGFTAGAHTVKIGWVEKAKDSKDRDIIRVTVMGENDEEGECTLWLHSPGGAKMSIIKVLGILVHNVAEAKKPTISDFGKRVFANVKDPIDAQDGLFKILNEKLIGKEAFIFAEPRDGYQTTKYVDLWHYDQSNRKPAETTPEATPVAESEKLDESDLPDNLFD